MRLTRIGAISLVTLFCISCVCLAGDLNPSAAPAPTMKTLDQVEPRIPIDKGDLPLTIKDSGSYYFTESITYEGGGTGDGNAAIDIQCDNVKIDLMGFTLNGMSTSKCTTGIYAMDKKRITVVNGNTLNFTQYCIRLDGEAGWYNAVDGINAENCTYGIKLADRCSAKNCKFYRATAMSLWVGHNAIVSDCVIRNIPKTCQDGIRAGYGSIVQRCTVDAVTNVGIVADDNSLIKDCIVTNSDNTAINGGIGSAISNCVVYGCKTMGISANTKCIVENCSVNGAITGIKAVSGGSLRNNRVNGGSVGIDAERGTLIEGNQLYEIDFAMELYNHCTVRNNNIYDIYSIGIKAEGDNNIIEGNSVMSEGTTRKGIQLLGNYNICINNILINPIDVDNSGSNNKISNTTF